MNRPLVILGSLTAFVFLIQEFTPVPAQSVERRSQTVEARRALDSARTQQRSARLRAERLEAEMARAEEASATARKKAAALAARVQQAEAAVTAAEAELGMIEQQRQRLARDLATRIEPAAELTAALETFSRRPLVLAALQPGSLQDVVHTRAILGSTLPDVRRQTASLRANIDRTTSLAADRAEILAERRKAQGALAVRRRNLLAAAEQGRVVAEQAAGGIARERRRAFELAQESRSLDALVQRLELTTDRDGANSKAAAENPPRSAASSPSSYLMPVVGPVISRFGETTESGARRVGISIASRPQGQVVAPADGRVAFAGDYDGYGHIVIMDHTQGWTSVLTGLGSLGVATGQEVSAGYPLGLAPSSRPEITFELRRKGRPVDPQRYAR
ncbi:murein hydrolase activator EnvC family protein [Qipengyuania sp. NPDC077563]|uniref:murein hydrolase activator EnvC family protein n=1 Tax=Qipengyuania sp. NPDC077563 TaxID=3364497 RepID=UPI003850AF8C